MEKHIRFPESVLIDYCLIGWPMHEIIKDVLRRLHQQGMDVRDPRAIRFERQGNDAHFYGPSRPS